MKCPECKDNDLKATLTKKGVEVDYCKKCEGIWLDKGEIFMFAKNPKKLSEMIEAGKNIGYKSNRLSPKTGSNMTELPGRSGCLSGKGALYNLRSGKTGILLG